MYFELWSLIAGALLITMALAGSLLQRLPLSTGMLYLAAGFGLGPAGLGLMHPDPGSYAPLLERVAEIAVLISLFTLGLKLGLPLGDTRWRLPIRLATGSMAVTVVLIAAIAIVLLELPLGAAVLLGGILAPTDPVLASDVQVLDARDRDRLRLSLSAEGALNDGTAFPFVMLGLGLLGLHELGVGGWRWFAVDVIWAVVAGLVLGAVSGTLVGRLVLYLRTRHKLSVGLDEFLGLGLIGLSYGVAVLSHGYGFLAVLAAGVALQRVQQSHPAAAPAEDPLPRHVGDDPDAVATDARYAGSFLMHEVLDFNEQLERIAELAVVLVVGAMLYYVDVSVHALGLVALLLFGVRPLAVQLGLLGAEATRDQRRLISWFGIRGIGSIYYLMYAINHGLAPGLADELTDLTLMMVATSIVLHGISVTPLMERYSRRRPQRRRK